ncbi:glycosyltransferase family 2 protein [bacterium AH-315-M05]|nr:glycosyltransferase family 2 protein [bacterium AH-315-M05]
MLNNKRVSVVIPCRNEEKYIARCISSVINSDYPEELLEVLVCDGLSGDRTPEIVNQFASECSSVKYLVNEKQIVPYALNLGLKNATGDIIIILGAHAEVSPNYIRSCVELLDNNPEIGCVGGLLDNIYEDDISTVIAAAMSSPFGVGTAHFRTGLKEGYVDTVAFGTYRREVFDKVGIFDEELVRNQDDEFNYRVIKAGYKIFLSKDIRAKYYVRSSFKNLYKQYYQYGYWKVYVNKKHRTITTVRQLAPLLFVLMLLTGTGMSFIDFLFLKIILIILVIYFIIGMFSAIQKTINPIKILKIVIAYLILHISYGLGYLTGVINFLILLQKPVTPHSTYNK